MMPAEAATVLTELRDSVRRLPECKRNTLQAIFDLVERDVRQVPGFTLGVTAGMILADAKLQKRPR